MEKEIEEIKAIEERELKELELMNENENREFYVYVHIRLDNNTVFYVGKGTKNRAYDLDRSNFHNGVCKEYGCRVEIIKDNLTESQAFRLEKRMIEYYVLTLGYGIPIDGYMHKENNKYLTNFTWGGEGVSGMIPWNKGKKGIYHNSEEQNKKISEAQNKKVICITTGETFDSIKDAAIHYKVFETSIVKCCKENLKSAGKLNGARLQWKYLEDYDDNCLEEYKLNISDKRSKKVICITTGKIFDSIKDAEKEYSCCNISKCCNGKYKHAGKLKDGTKLQWKYLEDDDNDLKAV